MPSASITEDEEGMEATIQGGSPGQEEAAVPMGIMQVWCSNRWKSKGVGRCHRRWRVYLPTSTTREEKGRGGLASHSRLSPHKGVDDTHKSGSDTNKT